MTEAAISATQPEPPPQNASADPVAIRALAKELHETIEGEVRFRLDQAGTWMLKVSLQAPCDDCPGSKTEKLRSTMVLNSGG